MVQCGCHRKHTLAQTHAKPHLVYSPAGVEIFPHHTRLYIFRRVGSEQMNSKPTYKHTHVAVHACNQIAQSLIMHGAYVCPVHLNILHTFATYACNV